MVMGSGDYGLDGSKHNLFAQLLTRQAYFVAFGPHGPRAPFNPPNNTMKVIIGTSVSMLAAFGIFTAIRASGKHLSQSALYLHDHG